MMINFLTHFIVQVRKSKFIYMGYSDLGQFENNGKKFLLYDVSTKYNLIK